MGGKNVEVWCLASISGTYEHIPKGPFGLSFQEKKKEEEDRQRKSSNETVIKSNMFVMM